MAEKALVTLRSRPAESAATESALRVPAARAGLNVEQTTPQGVLLSGEPQQLSALESQGFRVKVLPETNILQVGNYRINIDLPPSAVPADLRVPAADSGAWTHHLVQLVSPPTPEWVDELTASGVEVVEGVGRYGLFVVGKPDVMAGLKDRFPFVAWTGPFQPAYRLAPNLQGLQGEIRYLSVGVYPASEGPAVGAAIEAAGGSVVSSSAPADHRGIYHRIVATLDARGLPWLARHPAVRWVEFAPDRPGLDGERECQILAGNLSSASPPNTAPLPGYRKNWLPAVGVDGTGVTIAICDSGVDANAANNTSGHPDIRDRQAAFVDYTNGTVLGDTETHGTHVAGIAVGNGGIGQVEPGADAFTWGQGVASGARFVNMNGLELKPWPPSDFARLTRDAVTNGAQVMNNSWHDGSGWGVGYTANARRFDQLVRDPNPDSDELDYLVIVFSAGNGGPGAKTIFGPKENKNTIVVGNSLTFRPAIGVTDDIRGVATLSSRGQARDGRLLPTVVAPGTDVASALSNFSKNPYAWPIAGTGISDPNNPGQLIHQYTFKTGTSMAAPHVAGACALIIQWWQVRHHQNPSPAMVKAILVNTAEDCAGGPDGNGGLLGPIPNRNQGWGRVNLNNIFRDPPTSTRGPRLYFDQDPPLTANGQERVVLVRAADPARPLRVTLAWTDAPGAANASPALVNDLDLEVTELATNQVFKGNVFDAGFSTTGGAFDAQNNVECVYLELPNGEYEVRVLASSLLADARPLYDTASPWQDYALVIDNAKVIQ